MNTTEHESSALIDHGPIRVVEDADGIPISGLLAAAQNPKGVIVALHGGATTSTYFDCPGHPKLSLLRTAPTQGFTVLALDRPAYGSSGQYSDLLADPGRRVELMYAAIDEHLDGHSRGAGIFLMAHSAGCGLALRMATQKRGRALLGLELAGIGREHQPEAQDILWGLRPEGSRRTGLGELLWIRTACIRPNSSAARRSHHPAPRTRPPSRRTAGLSTSSPRSRAGCGCPCTSSAITSAYGATILRGWPRSYRASRPHPVPCSTHSSKAGTISASATRRRHIT